MGRALFGIVAVFAQLCVDTIRDNSLPGLEHARAVGRVGGQPCVMSPERTAAAARMREDGKTLLQIADVLEVGKATVHRALAPYNDCRGHRPRLVRIMEVMRTRAVCRAPARPIGS